MHMMPIPREQEVRELISGMKAPGRRLLVTLDGPCATGKTTLAASLASALQGLVLHTDDFVVPHEMKTPERLAHPGGNCDEERLAGEVLSPWAKGLPVRFRRYDCKKARFHPEEELPPCSLLILEGSYCNLPLLRSFAHIRLFLTAPWDVRLSRLRERESPASLQMFMDRWIPLEDAYFAAYHLPDEGCILLEPGRAGPEENASP